MVVDFHVHCFPDELAERAVPALAKEAGIEAWLDGTTKDLKKSMKKAGIDCSVVQSIATRPSQVENINSWSACIQDDALIAFGSIHPDYAEWRKELERTKELGIRGVKFHPDYQVFFVDDPRMFPVYEKAFELGLILLFHAGVDIGLPEPYHCTPGRLLKVVKAFPGGRIIAAHMGGYSYWDDVEKVLVGEDIYFDTSYSIGRMTAEQAVRIIENHGHERILFGTDSPWSGQDEEISGLKRLGMSRDVEAAIFGGNAERLLNI